MHLWMYGLQNCWSSQRILQQGRHRLPQLRRAHPSPSSAYLLAPIGECCLHTARVTRADVQAGGPGDEPPPVDAALCHSGCVYNGQQALQVLQCVCRDSAGYVIHPPVRAQRECRLC